MIRLALIAWLALCGVANAQLSGGLQFPGPGTAHSAGAAYTGPGDVSGTAAYAYCGMHAYTSASIGSNAIRLQRAPDNAQSDFATIAGGGLDLSAISTFMTGGGGSTARVITCYDQTGNGRNFTQTYTDAPEFILSGQGSKPVMRAPNAGAGGGYLQASSFSVSQPFTVTFSGKRTAGFTSFHYAYGDVTGASLWGGWGNSVDTAMMYGGAGVRTAGDAQDNGTTSDFHAFANVFNNGGTSRLYVGNTSNAITSPGTTSIVSALGIGAALGQGGMTGDIEYLAIWAADLHASGTADDVNQNSCTYSGFSC